MNSKTVLVPPFGFNVILFEALTKSSQENKKQRRGAWISMGGNQYCWWTTTIFDGSFCFTNMIQYSLCESTFGRKKKKFSLWTFYQSSIYIRASRNRKENKKKEKKRKGKWLIRLVNKSNRRIISIIPISKVKVTWETRIQ